MALKKQSFSEDEVMIFDEAIIYKRGENWQFRMWLAGEGKYARKSLNTRSRSTAIDKGKAFYLELYNNQRNGKKYFSLTTKEGVKKYLDQRTKDVDVGLIVKGRWGTIKTHLEHWLDFIGRDTKLKELERNDCENYFYERSKTKKKISISPTTVMNEQSTVNAMMAWLFKNNETTIDHFEFQKLPRIDRGDDSLRRAMFTDEEIKDISIKLEHEIADAKKDLNEKNNLNRLIACYYMLIAIASGLRTGEQMQLRWQDIRWEEHRKGGKAVDLVKIRVRAETSKVRKTREFYIRDLESFEQLSKILWPRYAKADDITIPDRLIFSVDGVEAISNRAILYHFQRLLELAEIKNTHKRDLVPYSFRHYFITQKINSNVMPTAVAEMCGTSVAQIEKTYYHTTKEKMITNAFADYVVSEDGLLINADDIEEEGMYEE